MHLKKQELEEKFFEERKKRQSMELRCRLGAYYAPQQMLEGGEQALRLVSQRCSDLLRIITNGDIQRTDRDNSCYGQFDRSSHALTGYSQFRGARLVAPVS